MNYFQENLGYLRYTYIHKKAIYLLAKKILDKDFFNIIEEDIKYHDSDKLLLYCAMEKEDASKYHSQHSTHHINDYTIKTDYNYVQMILDYECAPLTKPDKPMFAKETVDKLFPELKDIFYPIIKNLKIENSKFEDYQDILDELKKYQEITKDMIILEINDYLNHLNQKDKE